MSNENIPASTSPMTIIGADTLIKGEMTFRNAARILGRFEGKIVSEGRVEVGSGSECKASIEAGTIIVDGIVEGDVIAHERLELNDTAQIRGDVVAAKLIAAEGASFSGHCAVGIEAVKSVKTLGQVNGKPNRTNVKQGGDLDNALAGLENKLAGFATPKLAATE
jgi:cytoskeletal protein CcmA (bactofilin family)